MNQHLSVQNETDRQGHKRFRTAAFSQLGHSSVVVYQALSSRAAEIPKCRRDSGTTVPYLF
jgi:hypothetical protein